MTNGVDSHNEVIVSNNHYKIVEIKSAGVTVQPSAINNHGVVVGSALKGKQDPVAYAFRWEAGHLTLLHRERHESVDAEGINNANLIIGTVAIFRADKNKLFGVVWKKGQREKLPMFPKSRGSEVRALNDKGQIVGGIAENETSPTLQPCLWDEGKITLLPPLSGGQYARVSGINSKGDIVGESTKGHDTHACLWKDHQVIDLMPEKGYESIAKDINDEGVAVGVFFHSMEGSKNYAFLWREGHHTVLPSLPGFEDTGALALNNKLQIVGYSGKNKDEIASAVIWEHGRVTDLNQCIDKNLGWHLQTASGINDRGEIIGSGIHRGKSTAFILIPN